MATGLDVWVAAPGSACTVDDGHWTVTVYDAHGTAFSWAGMSYAALDAPHGHWAGAIPPGTYVVGAAQAAGALVTHRAVVAVGCHEVACVRLFVDAPHDDPRPPRGCRVAIRTVEPVARERHVEAVKVRGVATGCGQVEVTVECGEHEVRTTVDAASNGNWKAQLDVANLACRCGDRVRVTARCVEDDDCFDVHEAALDCGEEQPPKRDVIR